MYSNLCIIKKSYKIPEVFIPAVLFIFFFLSRYCFSESDRSDCYPVVEICREGAPDQQICFDKIRHSSDSCTDLAITFNDLAVAVLFHRNRDNPWEYTGINYSKQNRNTALIKVEISDNQKGVFSRAVITIKKAADSSGEKIPILQFSGDRISQQDSLSILNFTINESRYFCMKPVKVITDRKFTYPPGYMRRGQRLNHPELSMFHCGKGVRMPESNSLWERGLLIVKYKVLHPPELIYDDPEKIEKKEALKNRLKRKPVKKRKKRKRSGLIKFNPL